MKAKETAEIIEKYAPKSLAFSWDNVGILCGSGEKEVKKVLLTLDVNEYTADEAINNGCDMIISHHPIFFGGIKKIDFETSEGRMIKKLIQNDITVFAAHTNMDVADGGINDALADIFGLSDIKYIEESGLGRYGKLPYEMSLSALCESVKEKLNTPCVRFCGNNEKAIKTLAAASGSCAEIIPLAKEKGCDAIITADMKYHEMCDSYFSDIAVIDAGHYPTEIIVLDIFEKILKNTGIICIKSENTDVFKFI